MKTLFITISFVLGLSSALVVWLGWHYSVRAAVADQAVLAAIAANRTQPVFDSRRHDPNGALKQAESVEGSKPSALTSAQNAKQSFKFTSTSRNLKELIDSPELTVRANQYFLQQTFKGLYAHLQLKPDQIVAFESALLTEGDIVRNFFSLAASTSENPALAAFIANGMLDQMSDKLRPLLGDDFVAAFRVYIMEEPLRQATTAIAIATLYQGQPLDNMQNEKLLKTLSQNSRVNAVGGADSIFPSTDWDAVQHEASGFLSAEQTAVLAAIADKSCFDEHFRRLNGQYLPDFVPTP